MKKEKHSKPPQSRNFVINILIIICIIVIIFSLYNISYLKPQMVHGLLKIKKELI